MAAVRCGADAVYLGGKELNARRSAENFDAEQLTQAVSHCHVRGVRVYLTLNTIVFEKERDALARAVETACACGVDALIVQDLAVAELARRAAPSLALHASTQMSVASVDGARLLEELGFCRVVLPREMSLREIRAVCESTSLQVECFVHGALCMSVSGQCYLSSAIGGRSGNRGLCAQPCRLPFSGGGLDYALSLKDMSYIPQVEKLREAGVRSLKIEGRMKRPEYVAAAVTACRQALDGEEPDMERLQSVFSRSGFTDGYLSGRPGKGMYGVRTKQDVQAASSVLGELAALYRKEPARVPVDMELRALPGRPVELRVADGDGNRTEVWGERPQPARTAPTTAERAEHSLRKTGGTPYRVETVRAELGEGLMLPASALNALRRDALDALSTLRGRVKPHPFTIGPAPARKDRSPPVRSQWRVRLSRLAQMSPALSGADAVILPVEELAGAGDELFEERGEGLWAELPLAFQGGDKLDALLRELRVRGVRNAVAGTLGAVGTAKRCGFAVHGDYGLNIVNTPALEECARLGLQDVTVSFEADLGCVRTLGGELPRGILAYGYLPLMALRNCPWRAGIGCKACAGAFPELTDRKGNRFFVDCRWQVATLYNCVPLYLADRLEEWRRMDFLTLYFTRETAGECGEVFRRYREGQEPAAPYTRGLYYRKVL